MTYEIIMAGFGGQGVMMMGQLIAYAGMIEEKQVTWMPSYGPEMRGGTANCSIIVSDNLIGAPIIANPDVLVVMNAPSLEKFEDCVKPNGIILINSSIIDAEVKRKDVKVYKIPVNEIATKLGQVKMANVVMVGSLLATCNVVEDKAVKKAFQKVFAKKPALIPKNEEALLQGMAFINQ